jgi:hypothetical protein
MEKVYSMTFRNRAAVAGFSILIVAMGVILVTFGMALIAALTVTGTLVGAGAAIYRRFARRSENAAGQRLSERASLDPSLEVQPTRPPTIAPPSTRDK